jgi:hypothetical protein
VRLALKVRLETVERRRLALRAVRLAVRWVRPLREALHTPEDLLVFIELL